MSTSGEVVRQVDDPSKPIKVVLCDVLGLTSCHTLPNSAFCSIFCFAGYWNSKVYNTVVEISFDKTYAAKQNNV